MFILLIFTFASLCSAQKPEDFILRDTLICLGFLNKLGCDTTLRLPTYAENVKSFKPFFIESINCGTNVKNELPISLQLLKELFGLIIPKLRIHNIDVIVDNYLFITSIKVGTKDLNTDLKVMGDAVMGLIENKFDGTGHYLIVGCKYLDNFMAGHFRGCVNEAQKATQTSFQNSFQTKKRIESKPKKETIEQKPHMNLFNPQRKLPVPFLSRQIPFPLQQIDNLKLPPLLLNQQLSVESNPLMFKKFILRDTVLYLTILNTLGCNILLSGRQNFDNTYPFSIRYVKCDNEEILRQERFSQNLLDDLRGKTINRAHQKRQIINVELGYNKFINKIQINGRDLWNGLITPNSDYNKLIERLMFSLHTSPLYFGCSEALNVNVNFPKCEMTKDPRIKYRPISGNFFNARNPNTQFPVQNNNNFILNRNPQLQPIRTPIWNNVQAPTQTINGPINRFPTFAQFNAQRIFPTSYPQRIGPTPSAPPF